MDKLNNAINAYENYNEIPTSDDDTIYSATRKGDSVTLTCDEVSFEVSFVSLKKLYDKTYDLNGKFLVEFSK